MTLTTQFYTMLAMTGMGAWLGASLDTYTCFVVRSKTTRWILFIHDLLFWAVQGLLFFYVLLSVNEGEFRLYIFLAVLLGVAVYQSLFKQIYLTALDLMIYFFVFIYRILAKMAKLVVFKPILWTFHVILLMIWFAIRNIYGLFCFFGVCLYKIVKIATYPLYSIVYKCFKLLPVVIQLKVKHFFQKGAGFLTKVQKLFIILINKFLKR
ncbi:spore cortex biosynthesis protein YabQ [Bacillus sp. CLL-7-23]|uniref:Spore cortex biosynthesis protein YabQ n=1 Tax=Bacillus changyiensis TaxID=3004103 RepID=A0ABT4XAL2_9BACI|nr:spore cortex biosynthesis protein YabQ [Bacillus changyiensis]MDA7028372.1 spore cortex biosynthesis protein YabQ [Bacillus changyiensis]